MRVPVSWLRDFVDLPAGTTGRELADALVRAGLEVEAVETFGTDLEGSLVVGSVLEFEEFTASNGKTIRWCHVDVGTGATRGIVCGARNFSAGDAVVVALPGAVLPGGFVIAARKTYGHVSDGMICSARELHLGDDHTGILVLPPGSAAGDDAVALLGLRDEVLDLAVTPDRGYCLSMRGIAREAGIALDVAWRDPADVLVPTPDAEGWPVRVDDRAGCDRFSASTVTGLDPVARSPLEIQRRIRLAGMRPLSLAVDVTNYVMLETGQPMHAFDRDRLTGPIRVRRARPGETLTTLDGAVRTLDPDDLLVTDDSGPIALAGVMGGAGTEIGPETRALVLEAAHWDPPSIARAVRRHKLPSEAARRFERGVDPEVAGAALARAAQLLAAYGGAVPAGYTVSGDARPAPRVTMPVGLPGRVAGYPIADAAVRRRLDQVGCAVEGGPELSVVPPSWRPDLRDPADLVEEVVRLEGYDNVPAALPRARPGRGLTPDQRLGRRVGRALAAAGFVEAPCYPFLGGADLDALGLPADDPRRRALRVANPLSDEVPLLRTTLLPGLLGALRRNIGRGAGDVALFEQGLVFRPAPGPRPEVPDPPVDRRPTEAELAALEAAVPAQPRRVAVALAGRRELPGWWGPGRAATWGDAVDAARLVAREAGVSLAVRADEHAPWHPGRCAALHLGDTVVGHAGELHPRALDALGLPPRVCAMELDLDRLGSDAAPVPAPRVSPYPVVKEDVALVVPAGVPAAEVEAALRDGAGELLESVRLFDVYTGEQVGAGRRSLAYALRFRAPDRTLTVEEASMARDAAVAEASRRTGAVLRGT
jgi:phenylalanyl-tRNA synthetase beta chain